ncbi:MAG: late competence development ComFB family protein [Acetivibrio ethanolgignens]
MPKKSSKTAHVLNLISPAKAEDPIPAEKEGSPAPELKETPAEPPKAKPKSEKMENILHLSENTEELSNLIKDNLEQEFSMVLPSQEETSPVIETPAPETSPAVEAPVIKTDQIPEAAITETDENTPVAVPPAAEADESTPVAVPSVAEADESSPATETPSEAEEASAPEAEFYSINVYEQIVKNNVVEYLERFGICTCSRCIADATALALTNLPSKYVITDYDNTAPLLSFFEHQFQTLIITELTKACLTVHNNPRHKR